VWKPVRHVATQLREIRSAERLGHAKAVALRELLEHDTPPVTAFRAEPRLRSHVSAKLILLGNAAERLFE